MIKRFHITLYKEMLNMGDYVAGIIQGLLYGLCSIPCETTLWDCESFDKFYMFYVDCGDEHIEKFKSTIDMMYPGLYEIKEVELA